MYGARVRVTHNSADRPFLDAEAGAGERMAFGKAINLVKSSIEAEAPTAA
jgi:hypothetical protein